MTAIPPVLDLDAPACKSSPMPHGESVVPVKEKKSSHFEYAFGRWFATLADHEFVLA